MIPVRQSTAFETAIGPVLDADGVAVTDCVVGDFKIKKTSGNFAALNGSATLTHVSAGFYDLVLTTSDVDTVGLNCIAIDDTVNACGPLYLQVIEEAIYDALFAASANAFTGAAGATTLTALASGSITAAVIATDAIDADAIADNAITAGAIAADAITDAKVASDVTIASVTGAVGSVTGNVGGNVTGSVGSIATGGIAAASFAAGAIDAAAIAANAIGASELASDAANEIADAVLSRNISNVEGTMPEHCLGSVVLACLESDLDTTPGSWLILRTDGTTIHLTKTLTTDAAGLPIVKVG